MHPIVSHQMATMKIADLHREAERHNLQARARRAAESPAHPSRGWSPLRQLRAALASLRMA